jgi:flagellar motor protein MotB
MPRLPRHATVVALVLSSAIGCANNPFRTAQPAAPLSLEPPPGVAAPAHTLPGNGLPPALPSYADVDGRQLDGMLTRSRQESQLMQTEITALREQLASTSAQLAQARAAGLPPARPASDTDNPVSSPAAMQSAATQLALPDLQPRFDGAVVRIDVPADRLFEPGTANLLPAGIATLTTVAEEVERVFPGHYVGIEGHTDSEPLVNASWGSPHQLTTARAAAVFDFLTSRTSIREDQLFLVAHGSNHPLVSNATPAGRARNRRVELVVYAERTGAGP